MRSSPSFYTRPRHSFHRSFLFFCLSLSLVTAIQLDGRFEPPPRHSPRSSRKPSEKTANALDFIKQDVSGNQPAVASYHSQLQHRKRDLPIDPLTDDGKLNTGTTADFGAIPDTIASTPSDAHSTPLDAHNSTSHDSTIVSHINQSHSSVELPSNKSTSVSLSSSPDHTPDSKHQSESGQHDVLNSSLSSDHTAESKDQPESGQHDVLNSSLLSNLSSPIKHGSLHASTSVPTPDTASGGHNSSTSQIISPDKTNASLSANDSQDLKPAERPAVDSILHGTQSTPDHSDATVSLNSSLSSNSTSSGADKPTSSKPLDSLTHPLVSEDHNDTSKVPDESHNLTSTLPTVKDSASDNAYPDDSDSKKELKPSENSTSFNNVPSSSVQTGKLNSSAPTSEDFQHSENDSHAPPHSELPANVSAIQSGTSSQLDDNSTDSTPANVSAIQSGTSSQLDDNSTDGTPALNVTPKLVGDAPPHSESAVNISNIPSGASAQLGVNSTDSTPASNVTGKHVDASDTGDVTVVGAQFGSNSTDGKPVDVPGDAELKHNKTSATDEAVDGDNDDNNNRIRFGPSHNVSSLTSDNSTDGDDTLNSTDGDDTFNPARNYTDLNTNRTGAAPTASSEDDTTQTRPLFNASFSPSAVSAHSQNKSANGNAAYNLTGNNTGDALLTASLDKNDTAAAALADLPETRIGPGASSSDDARIEQALSGSENASSLSSATSAHSGVNSTDGNTDSQTTNSTFLNETLGNGEAAAAALTNLNNTRTGVTASAPSSEGDGISNNASTLFVSPHNVSSLSSAASMNVGTNLTDTDTGFNLTGNDTDSTSLNKGLSNDKAAAAAAALSDLDKTRTHEGDVSSPVGSLQNVSSVSSVTAANDSADSGTAFNLTSNHTNSAFLNSTLATSDAAAAALTDLDKTRVGTMGSAPSSQGDGTGSPQNASTLLSATTARITNYSADGAAALNLTRNHTDSAFLNSTSATSDAAATALTDLDNTRTGVSASTPGDIGGSINKALSNLGSERNFSSLQPLTSSLGHNFTGGIGLNVTDNNTTGGFLNNSTDSGVAIALTGLNKTRTGASDTITSSLGSLNASELSGATPGSGFAISLPNSTFSVHAYNMTGLNATGLKGTYFNQTGLNATSILPINSPVLSSSNSDDSVSSSSNGSTLSSLNSTRLNSTEVGLRHNVTTASPAPTNNRTAITLPSPAPAFVPVSTLFTNPVVPEPLPTTSAPNTTVDMPKHAKPDPPAPFPTTWPRYIVPSNTPTSPPENSTLISILFSNSLNWPWLVTNSNASSQVLVFMPALVSTALHIDASKVVTQSLQAYQPTSFNSHNEGSMLTIWLGYIPNEYVDELQAMLKAPQSAFYNQDNPIYDALGKTVDSSLPITAFSSQAHAAQQAASVSANSNQNQSTTDQGQKMAVIASVTSCGAAILAIGLFLAARQSKQKLKPGGAPFPGSGGGRNLRPMQLSPNSRLQISAPMIGSLSHSAGHSHYYGQGAQGQSGAQSRPELQSFASFPSVTGGTSVMAEDGGHTVMAELPVRYEYGHARTTSTDLQQATHSRARVDSRSSWWRFNPEETVDNPEMQPHPDCLAVQTSRSPSSSPPLYGLGRKISLRRSDGSFGIESHQRPAHRRLQITRGADGLVSGIGRPVMKENSLFF